MGTLGWVVTERAQGACRDAGNVPFVGWILVSSMCSPSRNSPSHTLTMCLFFFFFLGLDQKDLGPTMCLFIVEETLAYMFHRYSIIFVLL